MAQMGGPGGVALLSPSVYRLWHLQVPHHNPDRQGPLATTQSLATAPKQGEDTLATAMFFHQENDTII